LTLIYSRSELFSSLEIFEVTVFSSEIKDLGNKRNCF